jgi:hypothetical protein
VDAERGEGLVEAIVATAIAAAVLSALLGALVAVTHRFGDQPVQQALDAAVAREMRVAVDVLKYGGATIAPATIATSVPMPGASPLPVQMSIATSAAGGATTVTITASAQSHPPRTASLSTTIARPAPLPNSSIDAGTGDAPQ